MRTRRLLPPRLHPGDRVALLSPASPPDAHAVLLRGAACLQALGLRVTLGAAAGRRKGYLAGEDAERARDLAAAFGDPQIKAIFTTRGGYGAARLLERFEVRLAAAHPKILVGFSDITTLHLALQSAGLVSFWGPMPCAFSGFSAFSARALRRAVMSPEPLGRIPNFGRGRPDTLRPGRAEGPLTGGTLTLLATSLGTAYEVQTAGRIVFLEDIGEEPYKIDRLLTHLLGAGKLADAAGLVLGQFTGTAPKTFTPRHSLRVREVFADRLIPLRLPVYSGLAVGHMRNQATLPYGVQARLDAAAGTLDVLEAGVR
jgi:muramoyltetrapeptide carboxypeptidase